jgi:TolB-like protein
MLMNYNLLRVCVISTFLLSTVACDSLKNAIKQNQTAKVIDASYATGDALVTRAGKNLSSSKPLIAATFVNIDDLEQTSSFGRIISKQVASRFTQCGFSIIEMLFRHNVFIKQDTGEFLLSRELRNISSEHNAQAVIVGTYAVGRKTVYVNALLIRAVDSIVIASHDYTLPIDPDVTYLLQNKQ